MITLDSLDVREKRGTFVVLTASGSAYRLTCSKNTAGAVVASGGSVGPEEQNWLLDEPHIQIDQQLLLSRPSSHKKIITSPVREIIKVNAEDEDELQAHIHNHRLTERRRAAEEELLTAPYCNHSWN